VSDEQIEVSLMSDLKDVTIWKPGCGMFFVPADHVKALIAGLEAATKERERLADEARSFKFKVASGQ
jgi:hypothetical protein